MKKRFLSAIVLSVIVFASCKKTHDAPPPPTGNKLLTSITKKESNATTVFNFVYDNSKRLISYRSTDNQVGILFSYDVNGNVIKVDDTEDDFKNVYTYTYVNNLPVSGSFKSWQKHGGEPDDLIEDDQLSYTMAGNQVSKIHEAFNLTGDAADFDLSYGTNGNLTKVVGAAGTSYTANFTYGNKKPVYPIVSTYVLDQAGFSLQFFARNELLSMSFDFPGTQYDESINTQYPYDSEGYVLTSSDGNSQITYQYQ